MISGKVAQAIAAGLLSSEAEDTRAADQPSLRLVG